MNWTHQTIWIVALVLAVLKLVYGHEHGHHSNHHHHRYESQEAANMNSYEDNERDNEILRSMVKRALGTGSLSCEDCPEEIKTINGKINGPIKTFAGYARELCKVHTTFEAKHRCYKVVDGLFDGATQIVDVVLPPVDDEGKAFACQLLVRACSERTKTNKEVTSRTCTNCKRTFDFVYNITTPIISFMNQNINLYMCGHLPAGTDRDTCTQSTDTVMRLSGRFRDAFASTTVVNEFCTSKIHCTDE